MLIAKKLSHLLETMTPQERAEVETFAAFVIARRELHNLYVLTDDIPTQELMQLVTESGSFDWLDAKEEDVYSIEDSEHTS
uniref:DUF2281 domain-containing protein n=1 Tax=Candidatus Methanophaga sp. ANME-1 ERB7 TaxID=2759913 RepID=A0A7G9ZC21_9EURY|nr:hypothetical protein OHAEDELL_00033 [Methanosarcinales archaeon ANME-1 ERB7]